MFLLLSFEFDLWNINNLTVKFTRFPSELDKGEVSPLSAAGTRETARKKQVGKISSKLGLKNCARSATSEECKTDEWKWEFTLFVKSERAKVIINFA